jgi:hypothetical protein
MNADNADQPQLEIRPEPLGKMTDRMARRVTIPFDSGERADGGSPIRTPEPQAVAQSEGLRRPGA